MNKKRRERIKERKDEGEIGLLTKETKNEG